jgi:glutathione synthase/RimK-type ligase-like ATP-grasp enzyme
MLRANGGRGIIVLSPGSGDDVPEAPFYTQYIPKTDEYRVHVWGGQVLDVQMKKRRTEIPDEEVNWQIRNHNNGFVFARDGVNPPDCVHTAAVRAVSALALDFGAVDIGYNAKRDKCRVYEVNTAPGLEGTTLDKYYEAIRNLFPEVAGGAYARRRA